MPGLPGIIFMHAVLLANTTSVLFWGEGPRPDQTRLWDQATGLYTSPANQPADISPDQNLWSGAHDYLNDAAGTVLAFGGFDLANVVVAPGATRLPVRPSEHNLSPAPPT